MDSMDPFLQMDPIWIQYQNNQRFIDERPREAWSLEVLVVELMVAAAAPGFQGKANGKKKDWNSRSILVINVITLQEKIEKSGLTWSYYVFWYLCLLYVWVYGVYG